MIAQYTYIQYLPRLARWEWAVQFGAKREIGWCETEHEARKKMQEALELLKSQP